MGRIGFPYVNTCLDFEIGCNSRDQTPINYSKWRLHRRISRIGVLYCSRRWRVHHRVECALEGPDSLLAA